MKRISTFILISTISCTAQQVPVHNDAPSDRTYMEFRRNEDNELVKREFDKFSKKCDDIDLFLLFGRRYRSTIAKLKLDYQGLKKKIARKEASRYIAKLQELDDDFDDYHKSLLNLADMTQLTLEELGTSKTQILGLISLYERKKAIAEVRDLWDNVANDKRGIQARIEYIDQILHRHGLSYEDAQLTQDEIDATYRIYHRFKAQESLDEARWGRRSDILENIAEFKRHAGVNPLGFWNTTPEEIASLKREAYILLARKSLRTIRKVGCQDYGCAEKIIEAQAMLKLALSRAGVSVKEIGIKEADLKVLLSPSN